MPVFTESEYRNRDERPDIYEAWDRLPVAATIDGIKVSWVGPLIELGHDVTLGDMGNAAWGYLESCGWQRMLAEGGAMLDDDGAIRPAWAKAFGAAARRLAEEGLYAGPENEVDHWGSWIAFEISEPHEYLKALALKNGWDE
jgi:hypothetical protein